MLNKLNNCYIYSHILDLAFIINDNNEKIKNEFDNIYDSTLNIISKSIYAPTGYVNSYFGNFNNIQCEYLVVKNVSSFKDSITDECVKTLGNYIEPHKNKDDRWSSNIEKEMYLNSDFSHDSKTIVYKDNITVYDKIIDISNGNINIANNELETKYNSKDIAELINWKLKLQIADISIYSDDKEFLISNAICESVIVSSTNI